MALGYRTFRTVALAAASANNVALSQTRGTAGALTLNGAAVSNGVATFDVARRVLITAAANESGITFTITGTDRYGRPQSEVVTGPNATTGQTVRDFLTVSSVVVSGAMTGNATVGTSAVGSSDVVIIDTIANPTIIAIACIVNSGTPNYTVEAAYNDFAPAWDLVANLPTWYPVSGFTAQTTNQDGPFSRPATMLRLTNNSSIGSVTMLLNQALGVGGF